MTDVAFGQYYPANSFVHRLDARTKIVFLITYIVCIFLAQNFYALGGLVAVFILVAAFSKIPFSKLLKSVKGISDADALNIEAYFKSKGKVND